MVADLGYVADKLEDITKSLHGAMAKLREAKAAVELYNVARAVVEDDSVKGIRSPQYILEMLYFIMKKIDVLITELEYDKQKLLLAIERGEENGYG